MAQTTPFDFLNTITYTKNNIYSQETAKGYVPFIVNRSLSYFIDTVLYANDMNQFADMDPRLQYSYFLSSISRRKRFSKWAKKVEHEDVDLIMQLYECNRTRAAELLSLLLPAELENLKVIAGKSNERRRTK